MISFDRDNFESYETAQKQTPHVLVFLRNEINHDIATMWLYDYDISVVFDTKTLFRYYRFKTDEDMIMFKLAFGGTTYEQFTIEMSNDQLCKR